MVRSNSSFIGLNTLILLTLFDTEGGKKRGGRAFFITKTYVFR